MNKSNITKMERAVAHFTRNRAGDGRTMGKTMKTNTTIPAARSAGQATPKGAANARLIAAAPDLLAALRELLAIRDECPPKMRDDKATTDYLLRGIAAEDQARAAIARATTP